MSDSDRLQRELVGSLSGEGLHLILLPTEKCNFRCTYCYEDFSVGKMAPETVNAVKRLIQSRIDGLRYLSIDWFGGEPLLAQDIIEDVCGHAHQLAISRPELEFTSGITTNGYTLDLTTVGRLSAVGVRSYQISLDGPRHLHNSTRKRADGGESFDRIWSNLEAVRRSVADVRVTLRIHLTPANLSTIEGFLLDLRDRFLGDTRFSVFLKPIEQLGGPYGDSIETIPHDDIPQILRQLRRIVDPDGGCPELEEYVCYASKPNSFVIRANGIVAKCTVALDDPRNHIGHIRVDGTL